MGAQGKSQDRDRQARCHLCILVRPAALHPCSASVGRHSICADPSTSLHPSLSHHRPSATRRQAEQPPSFQRKTVGWGETAFRPQKNLLRSCLQAHLCLYYDPGRSELPRTTARPQWGARPPRVISYPRRALALRGSPLSSRPLSGPTAKDTVCGARREKPWTFTCGGRGPSPQLPLPVQ